MSSAVVAGEDTTMTLIGGRCLTSDLSSRLSRSSSGPDPFLGLFDWDSSVVSGVDTTIILPKSLFVGSVAGDCVAMPATCAAEGGIIPLLTCVVGPQLVLALWFMGVSGAILVVLQCSVVPFCRDLDGFNEKVGNKKTKILSLPFKAV